jgi:transcriptional regulator MftR-like protein
VVAGGALTQEGRAFARRRYEIIAANTELQERELIKLATLSAALAEALRRRGVADGPALLAAEVAVSVFRVAFERWVADPVRLDLPATMEGAFAELKEVTAGSTLERPATATSP